MPLGQAEFILLGQTEELFWGFNATAYVYGGLYKKQITIPLATRFIILNMFLMKTIFHSSAIVTSLNKLFKNFQVSCFNLGKEKQAIFLLAFST